MKSILSVIRRGIGRFDVAEKIYATAILLIGCACLLFFMSMQTFQLQTEYRSILTSSSNATVELERIKGLVYAVVMESRGIYASSDPVSVRSYSDELLKRTGELSQVVARWEKSVLPEDASQFGAIKKRIEELVLFRKELVRRATELSPAAGREWGDNDANRANRTKLTNDLNDLSVAYAKRAHDVAELGDRSRFASWYLACLGLCIPLLTIIIVLITKQSLLEPLAEIAAAADATAAGTFEGDVPHTARDDEIGHISRAVDRFREALNRNDELKTLKQETAQERDKALGERDNLNDKYQAKKWQLSAAINSMTQGLVMLDAKATVILLNDQYRELYQLPPDIKSGSTLEQILHLRKKNGLFSGNVREHLASIIARIAQQMPSATTIELTDGRVIRVSEQPMAGGGWVATHEDCTEQYRKQRILERTERFLVTVIENVPQAIIAKDSASLQYTFVNRSAEQLFGLPRAAIMGKTARDLFPSGTAETIELQDKQLLAGVNSLELSFRTIDTPNNGPRRVSVRRIPIDDGIGTSKIFLTMLDEQNEHTHSKEIQLQH